MSDSTVRRKVLNSKVKFLEEALGQNRLSWLYMPTDRLPHCALFRGESNGCKMVQGGRLMVWGKGMKTLASGLAHVGPVKLLEWGPRNPPSDD